MSSERFFRPHVWFGTLSLLGVAIYAFGLGIPYYGDDYQTVFDLSPQWSFGSFFLRNIPESGFYRPIQNTVLWSIQQLVGLNTIPVHVLQLAMHITLAWLVYMFMRDLQLPTRMAAVGSLAMLSSQTNAAAILGNDTMSQVMCTLFGYLCLYLLMHSHVNPGREPAWYLSAGRAYLLSIVALALSLLSKAGGVVFLGMAVGLMAMFSYHSSGTFMPLKILQWSLPFALVTGAFLFVRASVAALQPSFGPGYYDFALGTNIVRNLAIFISGMLLPVSSAMVFIALKSRSIAVIAGACLLAAIFVGILVRGLISSRESYRRLIIVALFCITALFPMVLLNHVSELHTYNATPLFSVIVGVCVGGFIDRPWRNRTLRALALGTVLLIFASNIVAVQSKSSLMRVNGERSDDLIGQVLPFVKDAPAGTTLLLLNPCDAEPEYSVYRMKGFNVLQYGLHRFSQLAGRRDVKVAIAEECAIPPKTRDEHRILLTLGPDGVRSQGSDGQ